MQNLEDREALLEEASSEGGLSPDQEQHSGGEIQNLKDRLKT